MANTVFQLLSEFFARYGYWVVFFGVMLENVGLPIPGETVLLFAGFLAYQGEIHILPSILAAIAGATTGAGLGFSLGWYGGPAVVQRFLQRFPRLQKRYEHAQQVFLQHGRWAVFGARFITGLRIFVGIAAGVLRMPFWVFMVFSFAGAVCWALVIGYVGFFCGSNWDRLVRLVGRMDRIALALVAGGVVVLLIVYLVRRRKRA